MSSALPVNVVALTMTAESDWDHEIRRLVNLLIDQEDEVRRLRAALKVVSSDPHFKNLDEETRDVISKANKQPRVTVQVAVA